MPVESIAKPKRRPDSCGTSGSHRRAAEGPAAFTTSPLMGQGPSGCQFSRGRLVTAPGRGRRIRGEPARAAAPQSTRGAQLERTVTYYESRQ